MSMQTLQFKNTTYEDLETVFWLFDHVISLQGMNNYKVWDQIDKSSIKSDMEKGLQYKILDNNEIICIFSIQYNDPLIWGEKDSERAIYLHRIVVHPAFRGRRIMERIIHWTSEFASSIGIELLRLDTWADNQKIIDYYKSVGFSFVKNHKTPNTLNLPVQDRNLELALLEMKVKMV